MLELQGRQEENPSKTKAKVPKFRIVQGRRSLMLASA
jgi:hypothetical protein